MRIEAGVELTYCTNVHPGESLDDVRRIVGHDVPRVRELIGHATAPDGEIPRSSRRGGRPWFGVGLRLSAAATHELRDEAALESFRALLKSNDLYVFTINAFPHGAFHGARVKERVYLPDWRDEPRLSYTIAAADVLAALLPTDLEGSISTVPGCFRAATRGEADVASMVERMLRAAAHLASIAERTGKRIALALEPEPACFLETTSEAVHFFEAHLFGKTAVATMARLTGLGRAAAEAAIRAHVGVCFDTCHAAVEFEHPVLAIRALVGAGVRIPKIQLSAGLVVPEVTDESLSMLEPFAEPVYLHQVVARRPDGALIRYDDLPDAIAAARGRDTAGESWRIHFHVPLFQRELGPFESTQSFVTDVCRLQASDLVSAHLEVETYTWGVLPEAHRGRSLEEDIAREIRWAAGRLLESPR